MFIHPDKQDLQNINYEIIIVNNKEIMVYLCMLQGERAVKAKLGREQDVIDVKRNQELLELEEQQFQVTFHLHHPGYHNI